MKEKFIAELRQQLQETFTAAKAGQKVSAEDKYRCEGFMQAGVTLELVTDEEISKLINEVHIEVYGQSIVEKRLAKQKTSVH